MAKKNAKSTSSKSKALIFIDTNIFLDFYRMSGNAQKVWLEQIEHNLDRIISTCQIEMEFKKNRQKVILKTISEFKKNNKIPEIQIPPILKEEALTDSFKNFRNLLSRHKNKIIKKMESYIENPTDDEIYKTLEMLFNHESDFILDRENKKRRRLKHKARTRFLLGYPPRKDEDTSMGDALNWEWIMDCVKESGKQVIIVSRDSDYGHVINGSAYINTWLKTEYRKRLKSPKKPIFLFDRLAKGFETAGIKIKKEDAVDEDEMVKAKTPEIPKVAKNSTTDEEELDHQIQEVVPIK